MSQRAHKPLDALVAGRKAKLIDQVLVNRLRIPLHADLFFDPRPMRFASRSGQLVTVAPDAPEAGSRVEEFGLPRLWISRWLALRPSSVNAVFCRWASRRSTPRPLLAKGTKPLTGPVVTSLGEFQVTIPGGF